MGNVSFTEKAIRILTRGINDTRTITSTDFTASCFHNRKCCQNELEKFRPLRVSLDLTLKFKLVHRKKSSSHSPFCHVRWNSPLPKRLSLSLNLFKTPFWCHLANHLISPDSLAYPSNGRCGRLGFLGFKVHPWSRAVASVTGGHAGRTAAWHSVNSFMVRLVICHGTYRKRHPASLTYAKALRKHLAIMQERTDQWCLQWHLNPPTKEPSSLRNLKCQLVWHCWSMTSTFSSCIQNLEKSSLRMTKKKSGWWVDWEIQPWNMGLRWLGLQGHFIHLDPLLVSLEKVAKMYG